MPLFSIVTPTFNRLDFLREALGSIWAQRFKDYEVIIVDDGSTDGTADFLASLGSRVRVLRQANAGPGAARNLALRHATGEYIAFLDSDDLWLPWTLAVYHEAIERHVKPSFITGKFHRFRKRDELVGTAERPLETKWRSDYLATEESPHWYGISSFVMKRDLVQAAGGFTDLSINGEDADLALRLGDAPGFVEVLDPVTYGYREHGGNVRYQVAKSAEGALFQLGQEEQGCYPGGASRALERWRVMSPLLRACSVACLRQGLRDQAWQMYKRTLRWNLALHRWKYLVAFPLLALKTALVGYRSHGAAAKTNPPGVAC